MVCSLLPTQQTELMMENRFKSVLGASSPFSAMHRGSRAWQPELGLPWSDLFRTVVSPPGMPPRLGGEVL